MIVGGCRRWARRWPTAAGATGDRSGGRRADRLGRAGEPDRLTAAGIELTPERVEALALGRGTTAGELAALDEHGFVVLPTLLDESEVERLRAEFERLVAGDPDTRTHELGNRRTTAANDNDVFAVCWRHRAALESAAHLLGSTFQVGHVDLRDPEPRYGGVQRLHPDHGPTPEPGITATWFLDRFTVDNGATRMLPGSHRSPPRSDEVPIPGTEIPGPGEVLAVGPAGSLLLRDARLFHAGGLNRSDGPRRSALVFYQREIADPPG